MVEKGRPSSGLTSGPKSHCSAQPKVGEAVDGRTGGQTDWPSKQRLDARERAEERDPVERARKPSIDGVSIVRRGPRPGTDCYATSWRALGSTRPDIISRRSVAILLPLRRADVESRRPALQRARPSIGQNGGTNGGGEIGHRSCPLTVHRSRLLPYVARL